MNSRTMALLINKTLETEFRQCIRQTGVRRRLQEPDYTALLTLHLPGLINQQMSVIRSSDGEMFQFAKFSGCFIHQSPYVGFESETFKQRKICELGDLLIICEEILRDGTRYNSALLQLKLSRKLQIPNKRKPIKLSKVGDKVQFDLYSHWPKFNFERPKGSTEYNLPEKQPFNGAQYMFVCEDATTSFSVAPPSNEMYAREYSFAQFLSDFIEWETGKEVKKHAVESQGDWSKLIWDVIDRSVEADLQRANINENGEHKRFNDAGRIRMALLKNRPLVSGQVDIHQVLAALEGMSRKEHSLGILWITKPAPVGCMI